MSIVPVFELPDFDTGQYEGCELHMSDGGALLTIHVAELGALKFNLKRVRWHRFTSLYACPAELIEGCYFKFAEVKGSQVLTEHLHVVKGTSQPYKELHHFRIFLDETGCHEFLAESADAL